MSDKRYRVTYTGSDVVRLGRGGVFMGGTSAWCDEEVAREAAARGDFSVEGLEADTSTKPTAAASAPPAKAEKKAEAKPAEAKPAEAKKEEAKPAEAKPAEAKKEEAKPAEAKKEEAPAADAAKPA